MRKRVVGRRPLLAKAGIAALILALPISVLMPGPWKAALGSAGSVTGVLAVIPFIIGLHRWGKPDRQAEEHRQSARASARAATVSDATITFLTGPGAARLAPDTTRDLLRRAEQLKASATRQERQDQQRLAELRHPPALPAATPDPATAITDLIGDPHRQAADEITRRIGRVLSDQATAQRRAARRARRRRWLTSRPVLATSTVLGTAGIAVIAVIVVAGLAPSSHHGSTAGAGSSGAPGRHVNKPADPATNVVPRVMGLSAAQATGELEQAGFRVAVTAMGPSPSAGESDIVFGQRPSQSQDAPAHSLVTIFIAPFPTPALSGRDAPGQRLR